MSTTTTISPISLYNPYTKSPPHIVSSISGSIPTDISIPSTAMSTNTDNDFKEQLKVNDGYNDDNDDGYNDDNDDVENHNNEHPYISSVNYTKSIKPTLSKPKEGFGQITTKEEILLNSLMLFYNESTHFEKVLPIIHGQSNISLRILDWFITNYSKKFNVVYKINESYKTQQFNVYIDYKSQLKAYSKRFFDPFCRRNRLPFLCNNIKIVTTIGQLNFFRWAIKNDILSYVSENLEAIERNMNEVNKNKVRQYQKKNTKKFNIPINGPSSDISISATKIVNKHDVRIMVTFE